MQASEWQGRVGQKWAAEWRRTDRSFGGLTDHLVARATSRPVKCMLDIGCGAGELSIALARALPDAEIRGIDISDELVDVARERAANLPNTHFEIADAGAWPGDGFTPDLLISRHGVMFFPEPVQAFAHLSRIAAPNARLIFSCFRDMLQNDWASGITRLLPEGMVEEPAAMVPGPFAFADRDAVSAMLTRAGWLDVAFEPVNYAYVAGAGDDPVEDALGYFLQIGPAARAAAQLQPAQRAAFIDQLREFLVQHRDGQMVALNAAAWIVSARTSDAPK